jgi:hypothetical protein
MDEPNPPGFVRWRRADDSMPFPVEVDRLGQCLADLESAIFAFRLRVDGYNRAHRSRRDAASEQAMREEEKVEKAITRASNAIPGVACFLDPSVEGGGSRWASSLKQALSNLTGILQREGFAALKNHDWRAAEVEIHDKRCLLANADYSPFAGNHSMDGVHSAPTSQSAMARTKPVPIQGVIWHDANAPAPALKDAFDRFWQTLDAATVPAGDDRRIPEDAGAVLLSEATEGLHNALSAEHVRLLRAHGREIDPPDEIQLWQSDYADGRDATPVPKTAFKAYTMDFGRDGADARLMTAIDRAQKATACPLERHNAQNAIKPGGPHRRYVAGDVIRCDTLDALESVGKLLRMNDQPSAGVIVSTPAMEPMPLTADHETILRELSRQSGSCKTVVALAGAGPIRNRETVGRLMRELMDAGYVALPHGKRKGYALTEPGRERAARATAAQVPT